MERDASATTIGELIARDGGSIKTGPFGTTLKASEYSTDGVPLISVGEVGYGSLRIRTTTPRAPRDVVARLPEYVLEAGDIVFGRKGAVDRSAMVKAEQAGWFLGSDGIRLRLPGSCDARFISYQLQTTEARSWLLQHAGGTTMASLNQNTIERLPIVLPAFPEQKRIGQVLGSLDDKIELNGRMNETLEAMARALFKSWFVDFDPVRAKADGRDTGLPKEIADLFPDSFEDSELGEIPREWTVANIGSSADVIDCLHAKKPERRAQGRALLQLNNISAAGLLDLEDIYWIDDEDYLVWTSRMEASPGDCVVTNVGRVGAVAQIPGGYWAALGRNMTGVRCNAAFPFPTFLIECLLSDAMKLEITLNTDSGTILDALNVRSIPTLRFVRPAALSLVALFDKQVKILRTMMETNIAESRSLAGVRDALLPKLISGDIHPTAGPTTNIVAR